MKLKTIFGTIFVVSIFFTNVADAYDLPKIKIEKQSLKKVQQEKKSFFKSDWKSFELFEQKIKSTLAENENLPASSSVRVADDKNLIFVAVYKNHLYFLDKYSVEVKKNSAGEKVWRQRIFPVGKNIYQKNISSTLQTFCTDGKNIFNSSKFKNNIVEVKDVEDEKFLRECFKVGYYCAFGEEFNFD